MGQTENLLRLFAQSPDASEQECVLSTLLTDYAEPVISKIISYKIHAASDTGEEIYSEVMIQLVGRLQRLGTEENGRVIDNFNSYVAVTTYNACDRF